VSEYAASDSKEIKSLIFTIVFNNITPSVNGHSTPYTWWVVGTVRGTVGGTVLGTVGDSMRWGRPDDLTVL